MSEQIRVLVVDDSAFARKVLRQSLEKHPLIHVVGIAADGLEALEKIAQLKPDVITLDLLMPNLDGLGVLRELAAADSNVRVVLVSTSDDDSEIVAEALHLGAVGLVKKPTALATERLYELAEELVTLVVATGTRPAAVSVGPSKRTSSVIVTQAKPNTSLRFELVVVGTSTGGPFALTRLLSGIPADFPLPIAIALHIPGEYTEALAARLDGGCALSVVEAHDGLALEPGLVVLAKGGMRLTVLRGGSGMKVSVAADPDSLYAPSVDRLFDSAAKACGARTLGVVLTGMGDDGLAGSRAIVKAGGRVLTQSEESSVIYGMPRSVFQAGLSDGVCALDDMAGEIVRRLW